MPRIVLVSRSQRAQWWNTAALAGAGVLLSAAAVVMGFKLLGVAIVLVCAGLAWYAAPRRGAQPPRHWQAQEELVREGRPIVYWRPGCVHCAMLRLGLGGLAERATWVDIWSDPEGAAFVRDVNGGAEIVPTVILPDGEACTKPDPAVLRRHLQHATAA